MNVGLIISPDGLGATGARSSAGEPVIIMRDERFVWVETPAVVGLAGYCKRVRSSANECACNAAY